MFKEMENKQNRFMSVSYQLHSIDENGEKHLEEQTQQGRPFQFISGFGFSLDNFEKQLTGLQPGEKFDFTLKPEEAFGPYIAEGVRKLDREMFVVNGKFDVENIYPGAFITLTNSDDRRIMARVDKVEDDGVTVDANHPLAGLSLQFTGTVLENREATTAEIQSMLNHMGGCEGCGGGCGEGGCGEGGCGGCGGCH